MQPGPSQQTSRRCPAGTRSSCKSPQREHWRLAVRPLPGCPGAASPTPTSQTRGFRHPPVSARALRSAAFRRRRQGAPSSWSDPDASADRTAKGAPRLVGGARAIVSSSSPACRRSCRNSAGGKFRRRSGLAGHDASRSPSPTVRLSALVRLTARVVRGLNRASLPQTPALPSGKAPAVRTAP